MVGLTEFLTEAISKSAINSSIIKALNKKYPKETFLTLCNEIYGKRYMSWPNWNLQWYTKDDDIPEQCGISRPAWKATRTQDEDWAICKKLIGTKDKKALEKSIAMAEKNDGAPLFDVTDLLAGVPEDMHVFIKPTVGEWNRSEVVQHDIYVVFITDISRLDNIKEFMA